MNKIILMVDTKSTKHIYETQDPSIVMAIDKLLFNMDRNTMSFKFEQITYPGQGCAND